jgi:hypothetical protein
MDRAIKYQYGSLDEAIPSVSPSCSLPLTSAQVECSLITSTFRECDHDLTENYTALSYVWSDTESKETASTPSHVLVLATRLEESGTE